MKKKMDDIFHDFDSLFIRAALLILLFLGLIKIIWPEIIAVRNLLSGFSEQQLLIENVSK